MIILNIYYQKETSIKIWDNVTNLLNNDAFESCFLNKKLCVIFYQITKQEIKNKF
jgi:hypothetical protein